MGTKTLVTIGMVIGSTIGGYLPTLFGAGVLSYWGIIWSGVGGVLGVLIAYKLSS